MAETCDILWLGERGLTIQLPSRDPDRVMAIAAAIDAEIARGALPGAIETLPALRSVTLFFDPLRADAENWLPRLRMIAADPPLIAVKPRTHVIPVCCDRDFAPDLAYLADRAGISEETFLDCFLAGAPKVLMLGFLPGFAYLGDIPLPCQAPRRAQPRADVPPGSLAIAGAMCAIYPWNSPGGWNLIGRTPIPLFDTANDQRPSLFAPGDVVTWRRIARAEYDQLAAP